MTGRLLAYHLLEREMLDLDACGDPRADELRDLMDPLWYALTPEELAFLDAREPAPSSVIAPEPGAGPSLVGVAPPADPVTFLNAAV